MGSFYAYAVYMIEVNYLNSGLSVCKFEEIEFHLQFDSDRLVGMALYVVFQFRYFFVSGNIFI